MSINLHKYQWGGDKIIMHQTRGTNHMFQRMSQLRQEGPLSLITSSISLITSLNMHFLSLSTLYFFPCSFCLLLKNCKERQLGVIPSDAFLWLHFHQETRTKGRNGGRRWESQTKQAREVGILGVIQDPIGWGCNGLRLIWTMRPAHWLTPQLNGWQQQTAPLPKVAQEAKLKDFFFFPLWGLQCQGKGHRSTNSQAICDGVVCQNKIYYRSFVKGLHVRKSQVKTKYKRLKLRGRDSRRNERWRKK